VAFAGFAGRVRDRGRMAGKRRNPAELPVPIDVLHRIGAKRRTDANDGTSIDVILARLATHQCGVVGRDQLVALGFTRREINRRVDARRLIRLHQGVYAVGHEALSDRGRMIAALLAAGPGAALSHRTAAYLWKILPSMPSFVDVTLTDRKPRSRHELKIHRAVSLETTRHHGLLTTTPLQTIDQLKEPDATRARAEALVQRLIPRTADDHAEPTRSELERALLPALRRAGLPRPLVNHPVCGHEVDFYWPQQRLIVETDGWATHGHRAAFERDRAHDAARQAAGFTVVRFTWRQVLEETLLVTVQIGQLLARGTPHHAQVTPPAGG
jgi:very-short-patch-repair endonuclease